MVKVRVPATSANIGPGFDSMGIALGLYNYVTAEEIIRADCRLIFWMTQKNSCLKMRTT